MRKKKHWKITKKMTSIALAMTMALELAPNLALNVNATVSEDLVSKLAKVYDGDMELAREKLEAMYQSGIIDENGNMIEPEIKEDGKTVSLDDIATRIVNGEETGMLTANGYAVNRDKILQLSEAKGVLELIRILQDGTDVDITDDHISNFDALISGIADGSVDLESVIRNGGSLSIDDAKKDEINDVTSSDELLRPNTRNIKSAIRAAVDDEFPSTKNGEGTVTADSSGKFSAPYLSNSEYNSSFSFQLADPENNTFYTDSQYCGIKTDGIISLSCADTATANSKVTVKATLNKAQAFPVSFDYAAAGGGIGASGNGTVVWNAGETGEKTFEITIGKKGTGNDDYWRGKRAVTVRVGNVKGALLDGSKTAWNKTIKIAASDGEKIRESYVWINKGTFNGSDFSINHPYPQGTYYRKGINFDGDEVRATVNWYAWSESYTTILLYAFGDDGNPCRNGTQITKTSKTGTYTNTFTARINPGQQNFNIAFDNYKMQTDTNYSKMNSVKIEIKKPPTKTVIQSVTVPSGKYYSGQIVPVTIHMSNYAIPTAGTKLIVNNTECPLLDEVGIESKTLTFAYTVKDVDTGAINVTGVKDNGKLKNYGNLDVTIDGSFPQTSFGVKDGITIESSIKQNSIDLSNVKYGISDDAPGEQTMTVLIPFKLGAKLDWVANEDCSLNGKVIEMPLPGMPNATASHYLKGAYFSYDNGKTRYPVYIVDNNGQEGVALAVRFVPTMNTTSYLRQDTINLFMDMTIGIADASTYVDTWDKIRTDTKGYAYFDGTGKTAAPVVVGSGYSYYVKGGVMFDPYAYISRGNENYAEKTDKDNSYLNYDDGNHVLLWDAEHPDNQYDVEVIANNAMYKAVAQGFRAEDSADLTLKLHFSDRKKFTFTDMKYFSWKSSDKNIADIEMDDDGVAHISITGNSGDVEFTLTAYNGSESKKFDLPPVKLTVIEGKTPFISISKYSQIRHSMTLTDTDIHFSSNLTVRNAQAGHDTTIYSAKLYRAKAVQGETEKFVKEGEAVWTGVFNSTVDDIATHITVPGDILTQQGTYAVEITAKYLGGQVDGRPTPEEDLSASAYIIAKQAPAVVKLNKLESYYVTNNTIPEIGYSVLPESDKTQVEYTIQKSGEEVSERKTVSGGKIPFSASKPSTLKEAYVITVYARNSEDEEWSADSMLLTVYNPDILHQIVTEVTAGEIGGTTGGTGNYADGTTIQMDNHAKLASYGINDGNYKLSYEDLTALRTDMSLQKIVSINYGEAAYGLLSDKMQWKSSDSDTVSVNYEQGGIYSDLNNYTYTSYTPSTDFLLVGKNETEDGKPVTITATHANTGMESSFDVTTKSLKDQLYVFQFSPAVKTDVIYTNGKGIKHTLTSNEKGELAVYEPEGIAGTVMTMSHKDDKTYVGTLYPQDLETGERDVASLQLYPCNNLRLREISNATLSFLNPDGQKYNGSVTIRGGVYKNGTYCPDALIRVGDSGTAQNGREDIKAYVKDGKLDLRLDPTQFKIKPDSTDEYGGAQPGDNITYVFEYRFDNTYQPGYVVLNASTDLEGASSPSDSVINMRKNTGGDTLPQITRQVLKQYMDGEPLEGTSDVIDYKDHIGISPRYDKAELITDVALLDSDITRDEKGFAVCKAENMPTFSLCTLNDKKLTGQTENKKTEADQIIDLSELNNSTLFVFPFSSVPMTRNIYTMTDENMSHDGIGSDENNSNPYSAVKAVFTKNGKNIKYENLGFGVANLTHAKELGGDGGDTEDLAKNIRESVKEKLSAGELGSVSAGNMLMSGFACLGGMKFASSDFPINVLIVPTEDPSVFRIVVLILKDDRSHNAEEGFKWWAKPDANNSFNGNQANEGNAGLGLSGGYAWKTIKNGFKGKFDFLGTGDTITVKDKDGNVIKDKDDKEMTKEVNEINNLDEGMNPIDKPIKDWSINPYGSIVIEAKYNGGLDWDYKVTGGSIGANFDFILTWKMNSICGPAPVTIRIDAVIEGDLELRFASKKEALARMVDFGLGLSINAFAGIGFDFTLFTAKFGVFGEIGGYYNRLYLFDPYYRDLSPEDQKSDSKDTYYGEYLGHKIDLKGQIGVKVDIKFTLIKYSKTFCSVGFNWSKKWDDFDKVMANWEKQGYTDLSGTTSNGQRWDATLDSNGVATFSVDGGRTIEDRDYLKMTPRTSLMSPKRALMRKSSDGMVELQSNAYPYSNPVLSDDGNFLLYLSDNNNADAPESVVCYAVKDEYGNYSDMGRVDKSDNNILADTDVVVSGTRNNAFAAWIKQMDSPEKEMHDKTTYDDLGMMLNATEIYGSSYVNGEWKTERLTDNTLCDMAPTIASSGNKAIVAWRSLSASEMPEEDSNQDITAMFNAENSINYRIFDGREWKEAKLAYNGSAGTVNAIDSAMLPDGTSLLVYTVRTGEEITSTETFYSVIDTNGNVITTGRLTNDEFSDTNAKVTAVGDQFVLGWYSEHASGEQSHSETPVVCHDISLARINSNGSVDADFPESIGGASNSSISSDFEFSAPANNNDLNNLSIVWSQAKESDDEKDAGKYQLKAIRFYEEKDSISVTSPITVAETGKHYTIDSFDTYTDENGEIKAALLGSDYDSINGVSAFDTIDLTDLPIEVVEEDGSTSNMLTILQQTPITSMKLASGSFPEKSIDISVGTDLSTVIPDMETPVQFIVKNTGTSVVDTVDAEVGGQIQKYTNLNIKPGQSSILTFSYKVPQTVSDVDYNLTADSLSTVSGRLILNTPDIGISDIMVTREGDKTRDIRVVLNNNYSIPLAGSNKIVKLGFYRDIDHKNQIGDIITIDPSSYQDIDDDIYTYQTTMNLSELLTDDIQEVPEDGIHIFAYTWIEDSEEISTSDNDASVVLNGLLSKYERQINMEASLAGDSEEGYTVVANISNNSLQAVDTGSLSADILDRRHRILASVPLTEEELTLDGEQTKNFTIPLPELNGEPVAVSLHSSEKSVFLDAKTCGGSSEASTISLTSDNKPAGILPEATRNGYEFVGWFTKPNGGERITKDSVLNGGDTIYAQFAYVKQDQSFSIKMDDYECDGTAHDPIITGKTYGNMTISYYDVISDTMLDTAPSEPGHYRVTVSAEGNFYYNKIERTAEYWITKPNMYYISVKNGKLSDGKTASYCEKESIVVVEADKAEEGYKFGYWKKNGITISYNPTYTFYATSDKVELEAVYIEDEDDVERYGNAQIESIRPDSENGKIEFVSLLNVPEDCRILKAGIVATSDEKKADELTDLNADYVRYDENIAYHNYRYTWTKTKVTEDQTWYIKGYLVYEDAQGNQKTIYSDLSKATLNGSERIVEDRIVGTAVMDEVRSITTENKLIFVAMLNVPADCKINKAGIVATSDAEKGKNLTADNADYVRADETTKHGYKYTWTKTNVTSEQSWYVRPYLVYTDTNGKQFTVYGDLTTGVLK